MAEQIGRKCMSQQIERRRKEGNMVHDLTIDSEEEEENTTGSAKYKENAKNSQTSQGNSSEMTGTISKEEADKGSDKKTFPVKKTVKSRLSKVKNTKKNVKELEKILQGGESLDQTSDFSGGFTPYKALAQKKYDRAKASSKSLSLTKKPVSPDKETRRTLRSRKGPESQDKESSRQEPVRKGKLKSVRTEESGNDTTSDDNISSTVDTHTIIGDNEKLDTKVLSSELPAKVEEPEKNSAIHKTCQSCGESIHTSETLAHLKVCLRKQFGNTKDKYKLSGPEKSNADQDADSKFKEPAQYIFCQVCQTDLSGETVEGRERHVNLCIDQGVGAGDEGDSGTKCGICRRDLVHLSTFRRQQHLNHCADKIEKEKQKRAEEERAKEEARNKVLDCPLCGKPLKTQASHLSHVKACAKMYGVSAVLLKERLDQQREEYIIKLAAGVLPSDPRPPRPRSKRKPGQPSNSTRLTDPQNRLDEDTQLALALSHSLNEEGNKDHPGEQAEEKNIDPEKNYFSILMTPRKVTKGKKKNKKGGPERVPALLCRTQAELQTHLAAKVAEILSQVMPDPAPSLPLQQSRLAQACLANEENMDLREPMKDAPWWNLTKLEGVSKGSPEGDSEQSNHLGAFYVQSLMPPLTYRLTKSKKKGVDSKNIAIDTKTPGGTMGERPSSSADMTSSGHNDTLFASTQTAVYLAELAAESGNKTVNMTLRDGPLDTTMQRSSGRLNVVQKDLQSSNPRVAVPEGLNTSLRGLRKENNIQETANEKPTVESGYHGDIVGAALGGETGCGRYSESNMETEEQRGGLNSSGFLPEETDVEKASVPVGTLELVRQLTSMVDNPLCSDLQISVKNDQTVSAHTFMLAARCPDFLQELANEKILDLGEFDKSVVLAVLGYIYSGSIDNNAISLPVSLLAKRFHLPQLDKMCQDYLEQAFFVGPERNGCIEDLNKTKMKDLLERIWGSDYEESDSDLDEKPESRVKESLEDQMEFEEACDFVLTQRRKLSQHLEMSSEEEEMNSTEDDGSDAVLNDSGSSGDEDKGAEGLGITRADYFNMTHTDILSKLVNMEEQGSETDMDVSHHKNTDPVALSPSQTNQLQTTEGSNDKTSDDQYSNNCDKNVDGEDQDGVIFNTSGVKVSGKRGKRSQTRRCLSVENETKLNNSSCDDEADAVNKNNVTPGLVGETPREKSGSRKTVRRFAARTQDLNSKISGIQMLSIGDEDDEVEVLNVDERAEEPDVSADLFEMSDSDGDEEVDQNLIKISDGPNSPPTPPAHKESSPSEGMPSPKSTTTSPDKHILPKPDKSINTSQSERVSIHNELDHDIAEPLSDCNSPPDSLHISKNNFSPTNVDLGHIEDDHSRGSNSLDETCIISSRSNTPSPVFECKRGRVLTSDQLSDTSLPTSNTHSDSETERDTEVPYKSSQFVLNTTKRKRSDRYSEPQVSPDRRTPSGSQAKRCRLDSNSDKASSPMSNHHHLSPKSTPGSPGEAVHPVEANVNPMSEQHEAEYVISSDSDLELAAIDLTLEEESLSDGDQATEAVQLSDERSEKSLSPVPQIPQDEDDIMTHEDVWSDFDDAGFTEDFITPPSQGEKPSPAKSENNLPPGVLEEPLTPLGGALASPDYDPPTDMESDISFQDAEGGRQRAGQFETPLVPVTKKNRVAIRPWVPPSPFTPMTDYKGMRTPDLKKACQGYGVKAVPKKKMIKMLENIYLETHQYETDSELEQSFVGQSSQLPESSAVSQSSHTTSSTSPPLVSTNSRGRGKKALPGGSKATQLTLTQLGGSTEPRQGGSGGESTRVQGDTGEEDGTPEDDQESAGEDLLEESTIGSQTDSPVKAGGKKAKVKESQVKVKREKIQNYILSNGELYLRILQYEPLEFDEFKQTLKDSGINVGSDLLMDFLDEQNIQFTMRKRSEEKMKGRRSPARSQRSPGKGRGRGKRGGRGRPKKS